MWPFKADVKVKCYSNEELAKLLAWYRLQKGLAGISDTAFYVKVHIRGVFDEYENGAGVTCFEVSIPHYMYKNLRDKFIQAESFDPVLQQRAFNEILGR